MIVTGNIKKIMYMGKEISEARNTDRTVWMKQTVKPPPPPKPCSTTHQPGSGGCQTRCEKSAQSGCHTSCERAIQCGTCETNLSCRQQCGNCLYNCQNNQVSES